MKKYKKWFLRSFLIMSFVSLTSCSDGYYHPDLPEYTAKDTTALVNK